MKPMHSNNKPFFNSETTTMLVDKVGDQQFLVTMWPEEFSQLKLVASYNNLDILETFELILCILLEKLSKVPRHDILPQQKDIDTLAADVTDVGLRDVDDDHDSNDDVAKETPAP